MLLENTHTHTHTYKTILFQIEDVPFFHIFLNLK
jgi:hypothetical protein